MSTEEITGIVSVFIALCALGFTGWQGWQTRKHNKLSVRPHLTTWTHSGIANSNYSVDLINNGIGPAFIKSFSLYVDGQLIDGQGYEPIVKALNLLFSPAVYQYNSERAFVGDGYSMAVNEKCRLVAIEFLGEKLPSAEVFEAALKRVDLLIRYTSIYEEEFFLDSKKLRQN